MVLTLLPKLDGRWGVVVMSKRKDDGSELIQVSLPPAEKAAVTVFCKEFGLTYSHVSRMCYRIGIAKLRELYSVAISSKTEKE